MKKLQLLMMLAVGTVSMQQISASAPVAASVVQAPPAVEQDSQATVLDSLSEALENMGAAINKSVANAVAEVKKMMAQKPSSDQSGSGDQSAPGFAKPPVEVVVQYTVAQAKSKVTQAAEGLND